MEACVTLGMLTQAQADRLAEAGLTAYNHNLDTSPEFYGAIVTTRTYQERLDTLKRVRRAGLQVCCGGIIGMGESLKDRARLLETLANLDPHPESVPVNALVSVRGTPLEETPPVDPLDLVRMVATARIMMPLSRVRLSAGRQALTKEAQILCFLAGANSIFYGDKLLTTANNDVADDLALIEQAGLSVEPPSPRAEGLAPKLGHLAGIGVVGDHQHREQDGGEQTGQRADQDRGTAKARCARQLRGQGCRHRARRWRHRRSPAPACAESSGPSSRASRQDQVAHDDAYGRAEETGQQREIPRADGAADQQARPARRPPSRPTSTINTLAEVISVPPLSRRRSPARSPLQETEYALSPESGKASASSAPASRACVPPEAALGKSFSFLALPASCPASSM